MIDASEATREYWGELLQVNKQIQAMESKTVYIDVITRESKVVASATGGTYEARQHGGPVFGGRAYLVGEAGPEVFIPQQSGQVVSNSDITNNFAINLSSTGNSGQDVLSTVRLLELLYG